MWLHGGQLPNEYVADSNDLELCKMYHCTPTELDKQDLWRIQRHLDIEAARRRYDKLNRDT